LRPEMTAAFGALLAGEMIVSEELEIELGGVGSAHGTA